MSLTLKAYSDGSGAIQLGGVDKLQIDASGNVNVVNTLKVASKSIYGAKAWVNFNGIGTVAIRASGNVSSITDNGVGDYTINFAAAMPDANYSVSLATTSFSATNSDQQFLIHGTDSGATTKTTTALRVLAGRATSLTPSDKAELSVAIFR